MTGPDEIESELADTIDFLADSFRCSMCRGDEHHHHSVFPSKHEHRHGTIRHHHERPYE